MPGPFESHSRTALPWQKKDGILALLPMDIPGIDPSDPNGLIPAPLMLAPLRVRIPMWSPPPELLDTPHTLRLHWLRGSIESIVDVVIVHAPPPTLPTFFELSVPLSVLREQSGKVLLYYSVTDSFGGVSTLDPKRMLTVDMDRPQLLRPDDRLFFVTPPMPMDEAYLANHPRVAFNLPAYTGRGDMDRIEFHLSNIDPPSASGPIGSYTLGINDPLIVYLDAHAFRSLANGTGYVYFRVFDKAGNFSDQSAGAPFELSLIPLPSNLPPPQIAPPSYDDLLIKRDDARAGVFVRITDYIGWAPGDQVVVYWKGRPTAVQDVVSFPCDVLITWAVMRGPLTDGLAPETVPVRYEIIRGSLPPFRSFAILVNLNLTVAGQDHAHAPALLNRDLPIAQVWGLTSNTLNVVNHDDNPAGARARVILYENPQPGEVLRFYWNGIGPVASYTVQFGDVEGQLVFSTVIPWAVMAGFIHPSLPVYYTTSNGVNDQQSDNTLVDVNTGVLIQFPAPILNHTVVGGGGYLSCCSVPQVFWGVEWSVRHDDRFELNDWVEFYWEGYLTNNWELPVIEESKYKDAKGFYTNDDLNNGLKFRVEPYEGKVVPMRDFGSARAFYQVRRGGVLVGESSPRRIRIDLNYPKGGYCKEGDAISCSNDGVPTLIEAEHS
ncbi:hypothetical protein [Pseudomonas sp. TAE6080]|uniref:hypothetical protein n=1 Tax=Pseudomonas sp. TAE6080 TaxID=2840374 RepID=UPI001C00170C|nr:hypothetical protein [Pseudomonas sp. TAE6080]MBT9300601.1 hypothetical protein [Pseudomonas sp. TAE6080]